MILSLCYEASPGAVPPPTRGMRHALTCNPPIWPQDPRMAVSAHRWGMNERAVPIHKDARFPWNLMNGRSPALPTHIPPHLLPHTLGGENSLMDRAGAEGAELSPPPAAPPVEGREETGLSQHCSTEQSDTELKTGNAFYSLRHTREEGWVCNRLAIEPQTITAQTAAHTATDPRG